jgi:hypothetical protein
MALIHVGGDQRSRAALTRMAIVCLSVASLFVSVGAAMAAETSEADAIRIRPLADAPGGVIDLALAPNGQRLYALSADGNQVLATSSGREADGSWRVALEGASPDGPGLCLGCIDTSVVAILRWGTEGVITTHRIPSPPENAAAAEPLQRISLESGETAAATRGRHSFVVSPTRNWLATATEMEGKSVVVRAAVAGVRVSSFSSRHSPDLPLGTTIRCLSAGLADELVLLTQPSDTTEQTLSMFATPSGWELLQLNTGLREIRDVCSTSPSGTLWALTGSASEGAAQQPAGLWRLDAVIRQRRQAVQPVLVAAFDDPRALVSGGDDVLYAAVDSGTRVIEIRPSPSATTTRE